MSILEPATSPVLGYGPMDDVHAEFTQFVSEAMTCADSELAAYVHRIHAHLLPHFAAEDAWMRESEFPARNCHIDEHAAVLQSADEVLPLVQAGNLAIGRAFVRELERWFPSHTDYLDSALAAWMCKRRFGGKPIVLQKRQTDQLAPPQRSR